MLKHQLNTCAWTYAWEDGAGKGSEMGGPLLSRAEAMSDLWQSVVLEGRTIALQNG